MPDSTPESGSGPLQLPDQPNLEWLRKEAKQRLTELRRAQPAARLSDAQLDLARQYGFRSWRALKAQVDSLTVDGQLFAAAKSGARDRLAELLRAHPEKLGVRAKPYSWTLLHAAAHAGHLPIVELLLERGIDPNLREEGDNTYPMHWAAAAGHVAVVRRLIEAGGDVIGTGDDHELALIGWATCWDGADDAAHREIVQLLLEHGARHHIFSAIAMNLGDEVRRIVTDDPAALTSRMSRNENNQLPLQFAVRFERPAMVSLLLSLGADPLGVDGSGMGVAVYGSSPESDRPVQQAIRALALAELVSADRGHRPSRGEPVDLVACLFLDDFETAARLIRDNRGLLTASGALHLLAKRGHLGGVRWLLEHGADPNTRWAHWDAQVTPLHLAGWQGHGEVVRALLEAGADPSIRDDKHDGDAIGWANHGGHQDIVRLLEARGGA